MAGIGTGMEVDPPTSSVLHNEGSPPPAYVTCNSAGSPRGSPPATSPLGLHPLKRSNSAPMINVLVACTTATTTATCSNSTASICIPSTSHTSHTSHEPFKQVERMRRYSVSSTSMHSPTTPSKVPSRLDQIRKEETVTVRDREAAHEREVQSTMQMSQSWEELTISVSKDDHMMTDQKRPKSFGEPLHVFTSHYPYASSPSPTRVGKQCFSPSLQLPIRAGTLTPSPSPSPTRKTFARRSLSPITLRPSPLGGALKRKMEVESSEKVETYFSPPKRFHPNTSPCGNSTPDRLGVMNHPLAHSSLEDTSSPEQTVPFAPSITSASVTGATASNPASCFSFRPVRDSVDTHGTDSETSDMTETTDVSEQNESTHMADGQCSMSTDSYKHGT